MDTTSRPVTLPGLLVLAVLVLCGWTAAPARAAVAEPDWTLVAESIGEAGYYVDSNARHFKTDAALDLLRNAQDRSTPVFIAVLPGDVQPATAITRLKSALNRKGTYVVLAGDKFQASSSALPAATVQRAYRKATTAYRGKPANAVVAFIRELDERKVGRQVTGRSRTPQPVPEPTTDAPAPQPGGPLPGAAEQSPRSAPAKDEPSSLPLMLGVGAVVVAAAAGGFFLVRRRNKSKQPAASGPLSPGGGDDRTPPSA